MESLVVVKFVHVVLAIVWLGGGFALMLAGGLIGRKGRPAEVLGLLRIVSLLGPRLFLPASLATLASGLTLVLLGGLGWAAWVVLALAGIAFTAGFGALVLGPGADAALALADRGNPAAAVVQARRLFRLARLDYAVQFAIVFLMVAKPGWSEVAVLAGLASVVTLAALAAFRPFPRLA